jgi:hypothetical protein
VKIIILDIGAGLADAVTVLFAIAAFLIPASVGIYITLIRKNIGNLFSSLLSIAASIFLSMIVLYFVSITKGAEPYKSPFDAELIKVALIISSVSSIVILIISFLRFIKGK